MVKSFFDDEDEPLTPKLAPLYSASKIRANNKIKKTILIILTVVICAIAVTYFLMIWHFKFLRGKSFEEFISNGFIVQIIFFLCYQVKSKNKVGSW